MRHEVGRTEDGRWLVVDGRRWRVADPALPDDVRARVQLAMTGPGERGAA
jgi:hypothetical protein